MKQTLNEIEINGVVYVPKNDSASLAPTTDGMPLVIVRASSSGVHYGYLKSRKDTEVELVNARRLWYWKGACSLSQLATDGSKNPSECKFSVPVPMITVLEVCEILTVTNEAKKNIDGVPQWKS